MRISSIEYFQRSVEGMLNQQSKLSQLQSKASLGKKIIKPSDDPIGASRALQLRQDILRVEQYSKNSNSAKSSLEFEESVLQSITNNYQRLRELAISANNGSLSSTERDAISNEMQVILGDMESLANSKNGNGEYIFSGFKTLTQAISKSLSGDYVFQGDEGQRTIQLNDASFIESNDTGKTLFFNLTTSSLDLNTSRGIASITTASSGLVNAGTLPSLDVGDLMINNIAISAAISDGLSSTDAARSGIAIATAINTSYSEHGVHAIVNENMVNLGIFNSQPITSGQFVLNGVTITDTTGTEASLMNSINNQSETTGVIATQPGGVGTAIILVAGDGRNIQLQTAGGAAASFGNFDLSAGALNQVSRATVTLRSNQSINIQGALPSDIGLSAGSINTSTNSGDAVFSAAKVVGVPHNLNETYSIIFNAGGTSFDIVADSNPNQPLSGYDDITYIPGQEIEFNGLRLSITGEPNAGDVFNVEIKQVPTQNIFTSTKNISDNIKVLGNDPARLDYEIGVFLNSLESAESSLNNVRAQIGARLNVIDSLNQNNDNIKFIAQEALSKIEDLDYAEAVSLLSQMTLSLQISQQTFARIQSLSLFNFL
ncbi:flagellar hook-associated protein FlgL [Candidatus Berkiella cookevillensis]|uniref:Flagellar hook-associated protein 3 n=1 Tax=Candidatus Berkiella cookevillensis TaxID=437022 RepID=A0A0Q9YGS9_9GAMM|nr:flagellar hook-associated protein FlgL [Candidatus Berkiella cookevillensis]MCS5708620.1 flagellar hook-associated protein FlgL [Candidatus Berkiella cookevillensis]